MAPKKKRPQKAKPSKALVVAKPQDTFWLVIPAEELADDTDTAWRPGMPADPVRGALVTEQYDAQDKLEARIRVLVDRSVSYVCFRGRKLEVAVETSVSIVDSAHEDASQPVQQKERDRGKESSKEGSSEEGRSEEGGQEVIDDPSAEDEEDEN